MNCASSEPMKFRQKFHLSIAALIIWFGVLWWLSSGPVDMPKIDTFELSDKVCHFGYYGIGGLLAGTALATRRFGKLKAILLGTLILALVGASDELHQWYVPGRSGLDLDDWIADVLGGATGTAAALLWLRRRSR